MKGKKFLNDEVWSFKERELNRLLGKQVKLALLKDSEAEKEFGENLKGELVDFVLASNEPHLPFTIKVLEENAINVKEISLLDIWVLETTEG